MKKTVLSVSLFVCSLNMGAITDNQKSFSAQESSNLLSASVSNVLNDAFDKYNVYSFDVSAVESYLNKDGLYANVEFNFGKEFQFQLNLALYDVRSENYTMTESTPQGEIIHPAGPAFTYRGYNADNVSDLAYLTILPDFISGFMQKKGETFYIEPLSRFDKSASEDLFVVYNSKDVRSSSETSCAVTDVANTMNQIEGEASSQGSLACALTEIAIAATNDFVVKYGGATATQTQIVSQLNIVSGLYAQAAVDIQYKLVKFYAAASNQITSDSQTEIATCLSDFRTWGNGGGFGITYDVATLWVGRDLFLSGGGIGGYAYGGNGVSSATICKTNKYNVVEDKKSTSTNGVLMAHELGHNWGCVHQNGNSSNIMNSIVQSNSNVWTSTCISTISGAKTNATCTSTCSAIGIDEVNTQNKLIVFPNPASKNLNLTLSKSGVTEISIYNLTGELVYSTQLKYISGLMNIDIADLASGLYLLKAKSEGSISVQKFMVEN